MNVLEIIDIYKHGGAEKVYDAYSSFCQKKNIVLDRFTIYKSDTANLNYLLENNSKSLIQKIFQQIKGSQKLSHIITIQNYDKIVSFLDRSNIVSIIATNGKIPVIATVHNPPTIQYQKLGHLKKVVFALLRYFYNKKNVRVIAVSKQVEESLLSIGIKNVKIVYNPLCIKECNDNVLVPEYYFVSIGRLSYQKAPWKLIKALSILRTKYEKDIHLVIVGDGDLIEQSKKLTEELNVEDLVYFTGYVENPYSIIKKAYCMIFTSYFEGFPITVLEAFHCNTPVIGAKVAIPDEIRKEIAYSDFYYQNQNMLQNFQSNVFEEDDYTIANIILKAIDSKADLNFIAKKGNKWVSENCRLSNFENYK